MSDSEPAASAIEATSMLEELSKAFSELKSHADASDSKVQLEEIKEYFSNLERSLKMKFDELEEKEKAFADKESETRALIEEREAVVAAKELASLDRVQELKEAAVAAISEAREKYKPPSPEHVVDGNAESKVNSSFNGDLDAAIAAPEDSSPHRLGEQSTAVEVQPRPELTQFCEQMDAKGLLNFIMENQNIIAAIRQEIPGALKVAIEPARLVLDSLVGFYPPDQTTNEGNVQTTDEGKDQITDEGKDQTTDEGKDQKTNEGNKTDAALLGMRRSCIMLIESVAPLLGEAEPGADDPLNPETKQQAKAIADEWKSRLGETEIDASNGNSLGAEAFLQLLGTFRIASDFDEEELCKLVLAVAHHRKAPELCRSLGLTHKMPGIIEGLVSRGRQIDAVHFVQAFKLTESFPPVPLLKTYLKELRRNSQGKGANSDGPENDPNTQELAALKAVIKCVQEYKLEAEYPLDPLQKRQSQLEKAKTDKKRPGGGIKHHQPKKPRANGVYYGSRMPYAAAERLLPAPVYGQTGAYMSASDRYPQVGATTYDYQGPSQGAYGQPPVAQRPYYYPQDERVPVGSYGGAPSSYGAYPGSGLQSSHQSYI